MTGQTIVIRLITAMAALALLLAGCAPAATPPPTATLPPTAAPTLAPTATPVPPTATPVPQAKATAAGRAFVSTRYGYTVSVPAGWNSDENNDGKWSADGLPAILSAGSDTFYTPDMHPEYSWTYVMITVAAHPLASGETLDKWAARFPKTFNGSDASEVCNAGDSSAKIQIGQEPTLVYSYECQATGVHYLIQAALVTHNGLGFAVVLWSPPANDQANQTFQTFWSSLKFTR